MKNRTIFSDVAILIGMGLFAILAYYLRGVNFIGFLLLGSSIIGSIFQFFNITEMLLTFYFTKFRLYVKKDCYHIDQKMWTVPILPLYFDSGYKFL